MSHEKIAPLSGNGNLSFWLTLSYGLVPKNNSGYFGLSKGNKKIKVIQVNIKEQLLQNYNKRNDKRFNNRGYSLFFLMGIFLKHLWLIPNTLKWQDCTIFIKLVPSQTASRSSCRRCSLKKDVLKNLQNFTGKYLCWSIF